MHPLCEIQFISFATFADITAATPSNQLPGNNLPMQDSKVELPGMPPVSIPPLVPLPGDLKQT